MDTNKVLEKMRMLKLQETIKIIGGKNCGYRSDKGASEQNAMALFAANDAQCDVSTDL